jgi:hypothetical protein
MSVEATRKVSSGSSMIAIESAGIAIMKTVSWLNFGLLRLIRDDSFLIEFQVVDKKLCQKNLGDPSDDNTF